MLFLNDEGQRGQGLIEYALVLVLVAVVVIVIISLLGLKLATCTVALRLVGNFVSQTNAKGTLQHGASFLFTIEKVLAFFFVL